MNRFAFMRVYDTAVPLGGHQTSIVSPRSNKKSGKSKHVREKFKENESKRKTKKNFKQLRKKNKNGKKKNADLHVAENIKCKKCGMTNHKFEDCFFRLKENLENLKISKSSKTSNVTDHYNSSSVSESDSSSDEDSDSETSSSSDSSDSDVDLYMAEVKEKKSTSTQIKKNFMSKTTKFVEFLVDTGASVHITNCKSLLFNTEVCDLTANVAKQGETMSSKLKGSMNWFSSSGKHTVLTDVYYFEKGRNLLSPGKLLNEGFAIDFHKEYFSATTKSGSNICKEKEKLTSTSWKVKVFFEKIKFKSKPKITKRLSVDETFHYHLKLGHIGYSRLKVFLNKKINKNPCKHSKYCVGCLKGKSNLKIPNKSLNFKATKPFQCLYMDSIGPITPMSYNKHNKVLLITCAYTKYRWLLFGSKSSKLSDNLSNWIKMIQNNGGESLGEQRYKIEAIHSDNGSEFINQTVKDTIKELGIKLDPSTQGVPARNGLAERSNRTITELSRSLLYTAHMPRFYWQFAFENTITSLNATPQKSTDGKYQIGSKDK